MPAGSYDVPSHGQNRSGTPRRIRGRGATAARAALALFLHSHLQVGAERRRIAPSTRWKSTVSGASANFLTGWGMAAFEYRQAEEIRDALQRHGVRYLFIGKSGAILLGFPDTTQGADLYVERTLRTAAL